MKPIIYFDIETGPLPEDQIRIPPFEPAEVKLGNIKDPAKIAAKIAAAESNHRASVIDNAALDPLTGQVLLIAYRLKGEDPTMLVVGGKDDEAWLLRSWWHLVCQFDRIPLLIGFNVKPFDLPFLIRRSWALGVPVPGWLRNGRYWNDAIIDLREVWQLGDNRARGSLESVSQHLGLGGKSGDGALFYKVFAEDREAAINYALRDLALTEGVHLKLCGGF
jgi:hypothetical protein